MQSIIIIGMGPGLSMGVAEKFGSEGYKVGMISRNEGKLSGFQQHLKSMRIASSFATADVAKEEELLQAIATLKTELGGVDVLHYNAVDYRMKNIMKETTEDLANGFKISVANALASVKAVLPDLKKSKGAVLLTGGGSATAPNPDMASISLGKAGIRNLALQLHSVLKNEGIYVGTLTINGWINADSKTHSPKILAGKFWQMNEERDAAEIVY